MSAENDLALAYHMGYDDALAKRMPDASKTEVLASGDLAAENAKLRGERDMYRYLVSWMVHSNIPDKLSAENVKLRELVKALLTCATDGDCDECRLNGATPWHVGKAQLCDGVWDRVRELGVEVDE